MNKLFIFISLLLTFVLGVLFGKTLNTAQPATVNIAENTDMPSQQELSYSSNPPSTSNTTSYVQTDETYDHSDSVAQKDSFDIAKTNPPQDISAIEIANKIETIRDLTDEKHINKLANLLGDNSAQVRKEAIRALGIIRTDSAIRTIGQSLFSEPLEDNRLFAIEVLSNHLDIEFSKHLLVNVMKNDRSQKVQSAAANALGDQM